MVAEGASRKRPAIHEDRETPGRIIGLYTLVIMERSGLIRRAAVGELHDAQRTMNRFYHSRLRVLRSSGTLRGR